MQLNLQYRNISFPCKLSLYTDFNESYENLLSSQETSLLLTVFLLSFISAWIRLRIEGASYEIRNRLSTHLTTSVVVCFFFCFLFYFDMSFSI